MITVEQVRDIYMDNKYDLKRRYKKVETSIVSAAENGCCSLETDEADVDILAILQRNGFTVKKGKTSSVISWGP